MESSKHQSAAILILRYYNNKFKKLFSRPKFRIWDNYGIITSIGWDLLLPSPRNFYSVAVKLLLFSCL